MCANTCEAIRTKKVIITSPWYTLKNLYSHMIVVYITKLSGTLTHWLWHVRKSDINYLHIFFFFFDSTSEYFSREYVISAYNLKWMRNFIFALTICCCFFFLLSRKLLNLRWCQEPCYFFFVVVIIIRVHIHTLMYAYIDTIESVVCEKKEWESETERERERLSENFSSRNGVN